MATSDYWSDADLKALTYIGAGSGMVNPDILQKIWDISQVPLPFQDRVGMGPPITGTPFTWVTDTAAAVDTTNALIDGADASSQDAAGGSRLQNHVQISGKVVTVTERAQAVDTIGRANELAYQIGMRMRDNRRDVEAISLTGQASVADNGNNTAGKSGGFSSWLTSNDYNGTSGSASGFNTSTGVTAVVTAGESRALNISTMLLPCMVSVYNNFGNVDTLMSTPTLISALVEYGMANPDKLKVANPTANVNGAGGGESQTFQGFVNVWVTSLGFTVDIVPNRYQQSYSSADTPTAVTDVDLFLIDSSMVTFRDLIPEHVEPLAKAGTADKRQLTRQWGLQVMDEKAHGVIRDIGESTAVTTT